MISIEHINMLIYDLHGAYKHVKIKMLASLYSGIEIFMSYSRLIIRVMIVS